MRKGWEEFAHVRSTTSVHDVRDIHPNELVAISQYKQDERIEACDGTDPLETIAAYAQTSLIYDANGIPYKVDEAIYAITPRTSRVNIFGQAYRPGASLWLHTILADIVVEMAIYLYRTHSWKTMIYDGFRSVEGAYNIYRLATDQDLAAGLLAMPGHSAHNKAMAVDCMMIDKDGREVEMGGHFDHSDMSTNMRFYAGDRISDIAKQHRLIREAAFLRAAFTQDLLLAPLPTEFWDDRLPENHAHLWRVFESVARVIGVNVPREDRWQQWNYEDFKDAWRVHFGSKESLLKDMIGVEKPLASERPEFYHGNFHPLYDRDLVASGKHVTIP